MITIRTLPQHKTHLAKWILILFAFCGAQSTADPLLNGVATHAELGKDQFIAGLFVSTLSSVPNAILASQEEKRLQVRVLAEQLSSRRFRRMWIEGMAINSSPAELERNADNLAKLSNMLKIKMIAGDIFTVDRTFEQIRVSINGTTLGEIDDPRFFDLLLRTWIGPVPLSSDFRADLLSEGSIKPGPLSLFESTRPSDARIAAIEQAVAARAAAEETAQQEPGEGSDTVAALTPAQGLAGSGATAEAPKVDIAAPKIETASPTPKPRPTPTPKPVIALAPQEEELDESIFEDDDGDVFTAESLLKEQLYYSQLAKYTNRFLRYPQRAWDRGREGNIRLRVTIDRKGKVVDTEFLEEAKYSSLNKEARNAVGRASPYPSMPEDIDGDEYSFTFRIAFRISNQ